METGLRKKLRKMIIAFQFDFFYNLKRENYGN